VFLRLIGIKERFPYRINVQIVFVLRLHIVHSMVYSKQSKLVVSPIFNTSVV